MFGEFEEDETQSLHEDDRAHLGDSENAGPDGEGHGHKRHGGDEFTDQQDAVAVPAVDQRAGRQAGDQVREGPGGPDFFSRNCQCEVSFSSPADLSGRRAGTVRPRCIRS
ncbi:hypothetical protein GCM10010109_37310 [Actinoplanes campanulatus]|nr:hypothetical protein GCM10010109_37310 [Actinoplanes campanulatus]